jgi:hypothetical protein
MIDKNNHRSFVPIITVSRTQNRKISFFSIESICADEHFVITKINKEFKPKEYKRRNQLKFLKVTFLLMALLSALALGIVQQQPRPEILPNDFSAKVFTHITYLADMGPRQVGSENDRRSIQYIKDQFENMKLDVDIQPFDFESFEYNHVNFEIGNKKFNVVGLGLRPYQNKREYKGTALLIDLNDPEIPFTQNEIEGKTIVTNNWNGHFRLLQFKPKLIIYIDALEFEKIKSQGELSFKLKIEGDYIKYHSANIIGNVGKNKSASKEILITAHFDTYRQNNPGASDNASGVGVLLELARYFKKMENNQNCTVKFIAFGGEEIGMAGSRNYLENNTKSLEQCELLFNIDDVGGNGPVFLEMTGGVSGIPTTKGVSQMPEHLKGYAWEGISSKWRILADEDLFKIMTASNHPQWLVDVANKSIEDLGYNIKPTQTMGSDQLTFAQAGIVTSGVFIANENNHTPQDVTEKIYKKSLKIAGELTAHVVLNTMKRLI